MKTLVIISALFLITNSVKCQDSLMKKVSFNDYSGDTIISYIDNPKLQSELPKPLNQNGEIVGIAGYKFNSEEALLKRVINFFSKEELDQLISSQCYLKMVCRSTGEILSASFVFVNKEPAISLKKFSTLSSILKENFTLMTEFEDKVEKEGYVKCSYWLFDELKKLKK